MNLFGLSFVLSITKWSPGKGCWHQLRVTDITTFLEAIIVERIRKKVEKCKLDIKFLTRCRNGNLHPTFAKVKRFKEMDRKHPNRYQRRLLLDEIANKHKHLKQLNKTLE